LESRRGAPCAESAEWSIAARRVDLLVGGFPCQDLSVAGKRAGIGGTRSGLFWEIVRIAKDLKPAWGLFENVPGLLSSAWGRDMGLVLAGLRECWPCVGYRVLDSRYFGVAQRRRRVFFVCGPDEARAAQVLFEPEGGAWDLAARGEARAGASRELDEGADAACFNLRGRAEGAREPGAHLVTHTLKAEGHDASEDGTGRGVPMVCFDPTAGRDQRAYDDGTTPGLKVGTTLSSMPWAPAIASSIAVRRLTPTECERLQGFPDGWTCLDVPLEDWARDPESAADRCQCPDSPRYRMMGNAVTVPVIEWLGRRLREAMR
jgi:DNA (cytosine-5)-methyltransferase 1